MKIAVICKDHNDFLNHQKSSENEYWEFHNFHHAYEVYSFDSIEITNKGSKLKDFDRILRSIRSRMKNSKEKPQATIWIDECTNITKGQWNYLRNKYFIGCDFSIAGEDKNVEYIVKKDGTILTMCPFEMPSARERLAESINRVNETLNKFKKQRVMEITEKTTIGDLIPQGYEIDNSKDSMTIYAEDGNSIVVYFKKKEVKDFNWYVKEYTHTLLGSDMIKTMNNYVSNIGIKNYDGIPFEIKIGLLKFICDDINVRKNVKITWFEYISKANPDVYAEEYAEIKRICSPEFLNSIFK